MKYAVISRGFTYPGGTGEVLGRLYSRHQDVQSAWRKVDSIQRKNQSSNPGTALDVLVVSEEWTDGEHSRGQYVARTAGARRAVAKTRNAKKNPAGTFTVVVVERGGKEVAFAGEDRDDALEAAWPDDGEALTVWDGVKAPDAIRAKRPAYYKKGKATRGRYEFGRDDDGIV